MKVGIRSIGPNEPPLVIAEIGINRGGGLGVTKNMVNLIASSGGECVKHQTHSIEDEMTEETRLIFSPNTNKSKFAEK
jgi:N-acetylneuraminate synthase